MLSRHAGESIIIGDPPIAVVTLVRIAGDKVRIGISADQSIPIHRTEVAGRIAAGEPPHPRPPDEPRRHPRGESRRGRQRPGRWHGGEPAA